MGDTAHGHLCPQLHFFHRRARREIQVLLDELTESLRHMVKVDHDASAKFADFAAIADKHGIDTQTVANGLRDAKAVATAGFEMAALDTGDIGTIVSSPEYAIVGV